MPISRRTVASTIVLVVTAATLVACANGEEGTDTSAMIGAAVDSATPAAASITREYSDAGLLGLLSAASAGEVEMSTAAEAKLTDAEVKSYAAKLGTEHKAMQGEIDALAAKIGVTPTMPRNDEGVLSDHRDAMEDLNGKAQGKEYDEAYLEHQINMHKKVLDEINDALSRTQNAEMRTLLEKAKTGMEAHLKTAEELEKKFGVA